jgi:replicative DNA helicase
MSCEGLYDTRAYLSIIGCLLQDPSLVDDIDRPLDRTDFNTDKFYELLFVAIYNLYMQGCLVIDEMAIDSYISNYKEQYEIFQKRQGLEYLSNARELAVLENYDYFYHRCRKYSLLRYYENRGLDTRFIYDSTITEPGKMSEEQVKFDNYTEQQIVEIVESILVIKPNNKFCVSALSSGCQAGNGMKELIETLAETPDIGGPLNNEGINTVVRGARFGCLYMRSLIQGQGKTRLAIGDACKLSVPYVYDLHKKEWIYTGWAEPTLFITTEMKISEIQTIIIAAVSKVNENHILTQQYNEGEYERVCQAVEFIQSAPLYIEHIPDFTINEIENIIKRYNREYNVRYIFFDYVWMSIKAMGQVNAQTGMRLQEHQLLLAFATQLKAIAQRLDVFIFTASQLNGEAQDAKIKNQNLLAGAKSLSNKLDFGVISMVPTKAELKKLEPITHHRIGPIPNMAHWCYKIRGGMLSSIIIWTKVDLGTVEERPLFVTNFDFELVNIDFTKIESVETAIKENSVPIRNEDISDFETDTNEVAAKEKVKFDW